MKRRRTGTEPVTARSPLRLRLVLAAGALAFFTAAAVRLAMGARSAGPRYSPNTTVLVVLAAVCGVLALVALLNLAVILRRMRRVRNDR
ncbi:hypothetical protein CP981_01365 [Streptomyces platensis]|uniref:Uncharacterized protein n=1 Tax=Streptomyces platensis TaxID=58346 RepID=A0AAE6NEJ0_STRPT|nr:DUF6343 family protein [Streptomyces platensis]OSY41679.1 hypothetical protein BG653_05042 [Streptomyces platensis]QEV50500.1 hypothetical protein CP981_01365 [Streptomyces platensis]